MTTYSTMALADFLDVLAAGEPVPGGGAAAALGGATGVSLLIMVASLPKTRTGAPEETADLAEAAARLRPLRDTLLALVDRDAEAYSAVVAAYRLPKATEPEKGARRDAIEAAMREATDAPLATMRACEQALRDALIVAGSGAASATSDAGTAIELLLAASHSARLNIDTNLRAVKDPGYVERITAERLKLEADTAAHVERGRALIQK